MLRGVRGRTFGQFIEDIGHDTAAPNVVDLHLGIEAKGQGNFLDIAAGPTDDERDGCARLDALIQPDEIERFRSVQCIFRSIHRILRNLHLAVVQSRGTNCRVLSSGLFRDAGMVASSGVSLCGRGVRRR
jgi:hypothetical protein